MENSTENDVKTVMQIFRYLVAKEFVSKIKEAMLKLTATQIMEGMLAQEKVLPAS